MERLTDQLPERLISRDIENYRTGVVGSGPIASAPPAGNFPAGVLFYDPATGIKYKCNYAGNFINSGTSAANDGVSVAQPFNANNDFTLTIRFRQDASDPVAYTGLFCQGTSAPNTRGLWIERNLALAQYSIGLYNSTGTRIRYVLMGVPDGLWHKIVVKRVGVTVYIYFDNALAGTIDCTGFVVNTPSASYIGSVFGSTFSINGQICCVEVVSPVNGFRYIFDQLSGTSILDKSGNGNNGTLTDGSPATFSGNKYWIPTTVLQ